MISCEIDVMNPDPGDAFVQAVDVATEHRIVVSAMPAFVYQAILELDLRESVVIRRLFQLRGIPARAATFDGLQQLGFNLLATRKNCSVVLGVAGRFWTRSGNLQHLTPEGFRSFACPGFAKATWSFTIRASTGGCSELRTCTKIQCFGGRARSLFKAYWFVVGPFSGWTRREALRIIKARAEDRSSRDAA
jgi:hypothetical protein